MHVTIDQSIAWDDVLVACLLPLNHTRLIRMSKVGEHLHPPAALSSCSPLAVSLVLPSRPLDVRVNPKMETFLSTLRWLDGRGMLAGGTTAMQYCATKAARVPARSVP
ncbi:hypothetical protein XPA_005264 [Xanthoria parietina]